MMKRVALYSTISLLAACAGSDNPGKSGTPDDQFTPAETVTAPEVTMQTSMTTAMHVDPRHLAARAAVPAALLHRAQEKIEKLTEREPAVANAGPAQAAKASTRATSDDGALYAFPGMGIADVDQALGGATGITPPDQGLCVGNGFALEMVNSALQTYDILGQPDGGPVDLAAFFNFPAPTQTSFSFASDPKCYFDPSSGRFFATILRIPVDSSTFAISGSALDIAVSDTSDPRGTWTIHEVDLTDNGQNSTPNHAHCPCLGDQPLIGADAHGFYVTTNEFGLTSEGGFNGGQIYALPKDQLMTTAQPNVVHLANLVLANGIGFSIQPATSATGLISDDGNGSEYFLSSLDFTGAGDNRIALWSLSNTASLAGTPDLKLEHAVLKSEEYAFPPPASQPTGPTPLRDCLAAGTCPTGSGLDGLMASNDIEQLDTNDDRMNQAVYAAGNVWAALNTAIQTPGGGVRSGIAMFVVEPRRLSNGHLGAHVTRQSYLALPDTDMMFPSIAVTDEGRGAMVFSLAGDHDFPSSAYVRIKDGKLSQVVRVAGAGVVPLDDSAGYQFFDGQGQGPSRFGDYSAALVDGSTLWMASESVTAGCTTLDCAARDVFTNWGTTVSRIDLSDDVDP
ncbi:MAG TPA: hypothetical protein VLT45_05810 [Kofleriaceae bacterium]|nr:hypothetical protein [Kofleriaceae bacterium]